MTNSATLLQKINADDMAINYVMLMITPMRREFKLSLNMKQFLADLDYAEKILMIALSSQDKRLQKFSQYLTDAIYS